MCYSSHQELVIKVDKVTNFISNTVGTKDGLLYVVSISMMKTDKQSNIPDGYLVKMRLLRLKSDGALELLELFDNEGKDLHYHDKEPTNHNSRVFIHEKYAKISDVVTFFQTRVKVHI